MNLLNGKCLKNVSIITQNYFVYLTHDHIGIRFFLIFSKSVATINRKVLYISFDKAE